MISLQKSLLTIFVCFRYCQIIIFYSRISMRNCSGQNTYLSLLSLEMKQDAAYKWPLPSPAVLSEDVSPSPQSTGDRQLRAMEEKSKVPTFPKEDKSSWAFRQARFFYILAFPDIFLTHLFKTDMTAEHRKHSWFASQELDNKRN